MTLAMDFESARYRMIARDVVARGVRDRHVIAALAAVPREDFVPVHLERLAYSDPRVLTERGHPIPSPYVAAAMIESLQLVGGERVLEVGTGSGYTAAVLSQIVLEVYTIEKELAVAESARARLLNGGYDNVQVRYGDGKHGWPDQAPFDAILVSARSLLRAESWREQLAVGGRLVVSLGRRGVPRTLVRETRDSDRAIKRETVEMTRLVPRPRG